MYGKKIPAPSTTAHASTAASMRMMIEEKNSVNTNRARKKMPMNMVKMIATTGVCRVGEI